MTPSAIRKITALLALLCAAAQPAAAAAPLARSLALAFHAEDHEHTLVLVTVAGHLDLVLSHARAPQAQSETGGSGSAVTGIGSSAEDHVLCLSDSTQAIARRAATESAPPLGCALAEPPRLPFRSAVHPATERRPKRAASSKSSVLRL